MKAITFIIKLLLLWYSLVYLGRFWKAVARFTASGRQQDGTQMPGIGYLIMAGICALPTLAIVYYIMQANGIQL